MRAVLQRVSRASVTVEGEVVGAIGAGMLILLCVLKGDRAEDARALAEKIAHFRFFEDETGRMNRSALELGRAALLVSQFTLAADGRKGRRPSFDSAAAPEEASRMVELVRAHLCELGLAVALGRFGARMSVALENDGPVTFVLDQPAIVPSAFPPRPQSS